MRDMDWSHLDEMQQFNFCSSMSGGDGLCAAQVESIGAPDLDPGKQAG
jgi:hypothetical protein